MQPQVDTELALHCIRAVGSIRCPIIKERNLCMSKKDALRDNDVSCAGRSIREQLEDELDAVFDVLMEGDAPKKTKAKFEGMGIAFTKAIALMLNPYRVDEEAVKEAAMVRWEERQ